MFSQLSAVLGVQFACNGLQNLPRLDEQMPGLFVSDFRFTRLLV